MNQKVKDDKDKKNNSSNSLLFGRWLQTKSPAPGGNATHNLAQPLRYNCCPMPIKEQLKNQIHSCPRR